MQETHKIKIETYERDRKCRDKANMKILRSHLSSGEKNSKITPVSMSAYPVSIPINCRQGRDLPSLSMSRNLSPAFLLPEN